MGSELDLEILHATDLEKSQSHLDHGFKEHETSSYTCVNKDCLSASLMALANLLALLDWTKEMISQRY